MDMEKTVFAIKQAVEALNNLLASMQEMPKEINSKESLDTLVKNTIEPPPRTNQLWTREEHQFLCHMWNKLSVDKIACRIGRTPAACTIRASIHGLSKRARP